MSDSDREFLVQSVPNLGNTKKGNELIIETMKRIAKRKQDVAKLARQYEMAKGGVLDYGFYEELRNWSEKNPLFGDLRKKAKSITSKSVIRRGGKSYEVDEDGNVREVIE